MLNCLFAGYSKLLPAILAAVSEYPTSVGCRHTLAESMLIFSLSARRLECTFHSSSFKNCSDSRSALFPTFQRAAKMPSIPVKSNHWVQNPSKKDRQACPCIPTKPLLINAFRTLTEELAHFCSLKQKRRQWLLCQVGRLVNSHR